VRNWLHLTPRSHRASVPLRPSASPRPPQSSTRTARPSRRFGTTGACASRASSPSPPPSRWPTCARCPSASCPSSSSARATVARSRTWSSRRSGSRGGRPRGRRRFGAAASSPI
jgi:hypothetical protein